MTGPSSNRESNPQILLVSAGSPLSSPFTIRGPHPGSPRGREDMEDPMDPDFMPGGSDDDPDSDFPDDWDVDWDADGDARKEK